jgi:hypothetical protein
MRGGFLHTLQVRLVFGGDHTAPHRYEKPFLLITIPGFYTNASRGRVRLAWDAVLCWEVATRWRVLPLWPTRRSRHRTLIRCSAVYTEASCHLRSPRCSAPRQSASLTLYCDPAVISAPIASALLGCSQNMEESTQYVTSI